MHAPFDFIQKSKRHSLSMLLVAILPITHDATNIRDMVAKLLPSVSLGYVTMPVEIVCRTVIDIDIVAFITINGIGE